MQRCTSGVGHLGRTGSSQGGGLGADGVYESDVTVLFLSYGARRFLQLALFFYGMRKGYGFRCLRIIAEQFQRAGGNQVNGLGDGCQMRPGLETAIFIILLSCSYLLYTLRQFSNQVTINGYDIKKVAYHCLIRYNI